MDSPKKILTIDGGGLRRVLAATIIFDCFYGTSTGAMLAAALARGMNASELKHFYLDKGAKAPLPPAII